MFVTTSVPKILRESQNLKVGQVTQAGADPGFWNGGTSRAPKARVSRRRERREEWGLERGCPPPEWGWGLGRGLCPLPRPQLKFFNFVAENGAF